MPNRMIKESIKTSDSINSLSWFAEVMFYRLLLTVDDYGRMDGRAVVLRNTLFPTRDDVTTEAIKKGLEELLKSEVIFEYKVDGKNYICFPNFAEYQRLRAKNPKYPAPLNDTSDTCQSYDGHMSDTCLLEEEVEEEVEVEDKRNIKETGVSCCETEGLVVRDSHLEGSNSSSNRTRGEDTTEKDIRTRGEAVNVLEYLNSSINSNYRNCDSTLKPIKARLKEGYSLNDCKTVIDKKCTEWLETDMAKFLRPSTLFAKGHFEEYLNAPVSVKRSYQNSRKVSMPEYWGQNQKQETMTDEEMRNLLKLQEEMSK